MHTSAPDNTIDLRSDTVTRPSQAMRQAMMNAPVGDDVFGEDPTINQLQDYTSALFGKEAALFVPSGTMGNQIAIGVHTQPGDEVICSALAHVYLYEGGGIAANSGASVRLLEGDLGRITAARVEANINSTADAHLPRTSLVCVEDTCNKGGGSIYDFSELQKIRQVCSRHGLTLHCDGARIFNALVETGIEPMRYAALFDSLSICLSKGLGAPVGSVLLGSRDFIKQAHRLRKRLGGGMRQAGILAAAGLYALQHNVQRLKEDHARARQLGEILQTHAVIEDVLPVATNIVIATLKPQISAPQLVKALADQNVLCFPFGPQKIRLVTHLHITDAMVSDFAQRLQRINL